ncbi:trigger factor [Aneurinibacillus soli]|uniref:Trigger factor n=1 Tax=Aneurinibacillus soli TaxID=1500254 RepID=A0A0U4WDS2_9BACL|nr:trigger factor [Aneurinibacillus soli]PYE62392.1 trigger factor [Aneurinibacillus soli]BAU26955.1 Trigger factor [Aneurinibacillus soli]
MKATWEKLENNQGVLTVEVEETRVDKAIDQAFNKVVKKINVPGFRKGKVPRKIFEARFGIESLYQDALDIILPEVYSEAVQETGIDPVDRPEVDVEQMGKGQKLVFKATVTVKPEVKLGDYKGLAVEAKDFAVTDEAIAEELTAMQNRSAELVVLEDDAAVATGDFAIIDFTGFVEGEEFEGGSAENYQLEIGSGTFIPGFEDQVIGMKKDEEKDVSVTFPEDYHAQDLAGEPVVFKVKVNEIKRKNLPELDDEFAKDVSEFDTLDELKADIKNKLEEKAKVDAENFKKESLIEQATANATIDIPEVMVEQEINHMVNDFAQRLQYQGMNLDLYYQFTGLDEEKLRDQFREDAQKRVRTSLVLEAISEAEKVEVTEEDVNAELDVMAEQYKRSADELRKIFAGRDGLASLNQDIRMRKTIDLLVANSK